MAKSKAEIMRALRQARKDKGPQMRKICQICGEGCLRERSAREFDGTLLHYSLCDTCGSEQADASQVRANKFAKIP